MNAPNLVTNAGGSRPRLPLFAFALRLFVAKSWRIIKPDVQALDLARKNRTRFVGVVAHRHDVIERNCLQFIHVLGVVAANVYSRFRHGLDRQRVHAVRFHTGGIRLDRVAFQRLGPALGHLTAARIPSAKK